MKQKEKLMTEQQFISYYKKKGFELYKTSGVKKVYKTLDRIEKILKDKTLK